MLVAIPLENFGNPIMWMPSLSALSLSLSLSLLSLSTIRHGLLRFMSSEQQVTKKTRCVETTLSHSTLSESPSSFIGGESHVP